VAQIDPPASCSAAYDLTSLGAEHETFCAPREICVMASDHPLATRQSIDPADLEGVSSIFMINYDPYRKRLDRIFENAGVQRRLVIETSNSAAACAMALRGSGVAIVNPLTALDYVDSGLVMRRFSAGEPFHSTLLRARHRPSSPLIDLFVAQLKSVRDDYLARCEHHLNA